MSAEGFHESADKLRPETMDMHRAIKSLMEEMEAADWYNQRADACQDEELKKILIHNGNEEKEHAVMIIEWIRRKDSFFADCTAKVPSLNLAIKFNTIITKKGSSGIELPFLID